MFKKKICMLGSPGVGKTSLVRRFVQSIFSEKYLATVGVKIDQKTVTARGESVDLLLWDMEGLSDIRALQSAYLRGAAGYLLVADGTRPDTVELAVLLQRQIEDLIGKQPFVLLLNKFDMPDQWKVDAAYVGQLEQAGWRVLNTSAKSGENVEQAFLDLAACLVQPSDRKA